jgi:hypothetical protein
MDLMSGALDVMAGANQQFQTAQRNLMAIGEARRGLERKRAEFDWAKKKNAIELEGMGLKNELTKSEINQKQVEMKNQEKMSEMFFNQQHATIDAEEQNQANIASQAIAQGKAAAYVLAPYMTASGGAGVRPITTRSPANAKPEKQNDFRNALKDVQSGNSSWDQLYNDFPDKAPAIDNLQRSFEMRQSDQAIVNTKGVSSKYKVGETRNIGGILYKRNDQGQWTPGNK